MDRETVFTYGAPGLKFGVGASDEIGFDLSQYDVRRVLVVTDPGVAATGHPQRVADQMAQFGIEAARQHLGHRDIRTTSSHYVEKRKRVEVRLPIGVAATTPTLLTGSAET